MSETGHATGMAGEFHAMEILHRLGHQPALTLGNAKTIDILSKAPSGKIYEVSVKAIRGGGKWGIGKDDYSKSENLVFMLFWYKDFGNIEVHPETWIIPAIEAEAKSDLGTTNSGFICIKNMRTSLTHINLLGKILLNPSIKHVGRTRLWQCAVI